MKECPYCAEEIQEKAAVCKFCGRDQLDKIKVREIREAPTIQEVQELVERLGIPGAAKVYKIGPAALRSIVQHYTENTSTGMSGVVVKDIQMSFSSMVGFMVKWAIASIPAMVILLVGGALILGVLGIGLGR